ncbi:hypothetical protein BKP56_03395 [Marinilactibacillus sp. 15R]|uniref:hypothetical protein n=1 Tax=Marinilactibacillus sp. 15R TaxID=1911586 RepID=UPI00090B2203|nr:hypothetical protein [Marinilactibacillus sp. 15R]API88401.1 hypothetical protein BKP56_03395 [Marinilactibacillus sp. 15R]
MLKKTGLKLALVLGVFSIMFVTSPNTAEAAHVESVPDSYFAQMTKSTGRFSENYGHTYKDLRFANGYTRSGPTRSQYSSTLFKVTYKYTYSYYTY